jgi:hypothetical protein
MVAAGTLGKPEVRLYRIGKATPTCAAFGRDPRVLVIGDESGNVQVLDLDTARTFSLFATFKSSIRCGYDPARERFTFLDNAGPAWTRALDTTPLSFLPQVDDALDAKRHTLASWRGLEGLKATP